MLQTFNFDWNINFYTNKIWMENPNVCSSTHPYIYIFASWCSSSHFAPHYYASNDSDVGAGPGSPRWQLSKIAFARRAKHLYIFARLCTSRVLCIRHVLLRSHHFRLCVLYAIQGYYSSPSYISVRLTYPVNYFFFTRIAPEGPDAYNLLEDFSIVWFLAYLPNLMETIKVQSEEEVLVDPGIARFHQDYFVF